MQVDVGLKQMSEQQHQLLPKTFQIFPLTSKANLQLQQQQAQVVCLSIVNGKVQNIQEPDQSKGNSNFQSFHLCDSQLLKRSLV